MHQANTRAHTPRARSEHPCQYPCTEPTPVPIAVHTVNTRARIADLFSYRAKATVPLLFVAVLCCELSACRRPLVEYFALRSKLLNTSPAQIWCHLRYERARVFIFWLPDASLEHFIRHQNNLEKSARYCKDLLGLFFVWPNFFTVLDITCWSVSKPVCSMFRYAKWLCESWRQKFSRQISTRFSGLRRKLWGLWVSLCHSRKL